jgi:hypothetical protein
MTLRDGPVRTRPLSRPPAAYTTYSLCISVENPLVLYTVSPFSSSINPTKLSVAPTYIID